MPRKDKTMGFFKDQHPPMSVLLAHLQQEAFGQFDSVQPLSESAVMAAGAIKPLAPMSYKPIVPFEKVFPATAKIYFPVSGIDVSNSETEFPAKHKMPSR